MNVLTATGNLGRDAEVRQAGDSTVCIFSVAMKAGYGNNAQTVWLDCSVWGRQAEGALPQYLKKGQQVAVSGELSTHTAENGKTYIKLRCKSVDLIGKRDDAPAQQAKPAQGYQAPAAADDFDDDIPF